MTDQPQDPQAVERFDPRKVERWIAMGFGEYYFVVSVEDYDALLRMWVFDRRELEHTQAYSKRMREAVIIACRSGKFGDPASAADRIINSLMPQKGGE